MSEKGHPNYFAVWAWLMVLAIISVVATRLPIPVSLAVSIVYGSAFIKAFMVAAYFMHLRTERILIVALVSIPVVLFIILTVSLLPDFVYHGPTG